MNFRRLSVLVLLATAPALWAQQRRADPHAAYVYPAGGRQGTSFQVEVVGQALNNITNAFVSGPGVQITVMDSVRPPTQKEADDLRKQAQELEGYRNGKPLSTNSVFTGMTRMEMKKVADEILKKLEAFQKRRLAPAFADSALLNITIAPDAPPGERELRILAANGLSNPLIFHVGTLPEFKKTDEKPKQPLRNRARTETQAAPATETTITLPATVNGQILQGGVDRFRFTAQRGQRLVAVASARSLIPYLADAVPGWFEAVLTLYDANGHELAYAERFKSDLDPVVSYQIPADGEYVIEIHDSIYRGREDFVYRLTIAEMPFVTSIFPLGGPVGAKTPLEIRGWNLTKTSAKLDGTGRAPGVYPFSPAQGAPAANSLLFALDNLPEVFEKEPNSDAAKAQSVKLPVIINGRIDPPGDVDVYRFEGKAGQEIVAEVMARRLCSPLNSVLKLTDAAGQQLAFNDGVDDKAFGLVTHQADSYLRVKLPADGTYLLHIWDEVREGGPDYAYRLRISEPRPDFELRAVPSSLYTRGSGNATITVYALRRDGFTNSIALALVKPPDGFRLAGNPVISTQSQIQVTLTTPPPKASSEPFHLNLEGRAKLQGVELVRPALPADDEMQAFAYRHLVKAQELDVAVLGRFNPASAMALAIRIVNPTPLKIHAGDDARVEIAHPAAKFQFTLKDPPPGLTIKSVAPTRAGSDLTLHADATMLKPGQRGTLMVKVILERVVDGNTQRIPIDSLPGVPFEIIQP